MRLQARIGACDVRSLYRKEEKIVEQMIRYQVYILAIAETKMKGKG